MVGGFVRDYLLNNQCFDVDIEVYGISSELLFKELSKKFNVLQVGKNFPVFKVVVELNNIKQTFDVAIARTENKQGIGHKGFIVKENSFLSFKQVAHRRDFSVNAMGIDVSNNLLLDPYFGENDLQNKILKHVSPAFSEDPLRVLRAAQFCARFNFSLDQETLRLCKSLRDELFTLSSERIFEEFKKILFAKTPSIGLKILYNTDALILFPELFSLMGCPQEPQWHPEGDVWIHTLMVIDEARKLINEEDISYDEKLIIMMAALCHDFGKPLTTIIKDGCIKSPAHENAGELPTKSFLTKVGFPKKYYEDVVSLVKEHLKPYQLYKERDKISTSAIKRLATRVKISHLLLVSKADFLGRTTKEALLGIDPSYVWLKEEAKKLEISDSEPKAILQGRDLISMGYLPGPLFTKILKAAFNAQLENEFDNEDDAKEWVKKNYLSILKK